MAGVTRFPLFAAMVFVPGLVLAFPARAGIPLFNGTCPGGLDVHADEGGPVYVDGRETQLKRFNDNYYEARDAESGVTVSISRTPDGEVDLSYTGRGGANGTCNLREATQVPGAHAGHAAARQAAADPGGEVTCESRGDEQAECDMDTRGDVELVRQLSHASCVEGRSWGLDRRSVWVKDGCRAVFRNVSRDFRDRSPPPRDPVGPGAELLGACNIRAAASGALVTRVPVNDSVTELIIDYPDGRFLCMVRNDGLVQSLTRMKAR